MEEILNAKIESVSWSTERGLSHWVHLVGNGWGVGFGGYYLKDDACYKWIKGLVKVLELPEKFSDKDFAGKIVRAKIVNGTCKAIGHPFEDKWFCPETDLK